MDGGGEEGEIKGGEGGRGNGEREITLLVLMVIKTT